MRHRSAEPAVYAGPRTGHYLAPTPVATVGDAVSSGQARVLVAGWGAAVTERASFLLAHGRLLDGAGAAPINDG